MAPRLAIRYRTPLSNPRVPILDNRRGKGLATRMGFEPTISGVTGQYVYRYTTGPRCAGVLARLFQCIAVGGGLSRAGDWVSGFAGMMGLAGVTELAGGDGGRGFLLEGGRLTYVVF